MASPQIENGYTKIANELLDALISYRIPGEQRQVLDFIIRKTYGYNKKRDSISLSQFTEVTGMKKTAVSRAISGLLTKKIISVNKKDNAFGNVYEITKDYLKWEPLTKKITLTKKIISVNKKDNKPLSKKGTTKESIKDNTKDSVKVPFDKIINLYHEILPELPVVVKLTKTRKAQIKARWFESDKTQSLDWWSDYFELVRSRSFLMGNNDRDWTADIDFLTTQSKFINIIEGKYR